MMGKAALGKAANGISGRVSKVRTARFPNPSSPCFTSNAGDCCPYIAIYKTDLTLFVHNQKVGGDLGLGPDSAMTPAMSSNRSCWVVFRMSAVHQTEGRKSVHRDSFGRFAADGGGGHDFVRVERLHADGDVYLGRRVGWGWRRSTFWWRASQPNQPVARLFVRVPSRPRRQSGVFRFLPRRARGAYWAFPKSQDCLPIHD